MLLVEHLHDVRVAGLGLRGRRRALKAPEGAAGVVEGSNEAQASGAAAGPAPATSGPTESPPRPSRMLLAEDATCWPPEAAAEDDPPSITLGVSSPSRSASGRMSLLTLAVLFVAGAFWTAVGLFSVVATAA